MPNNFEEIEVSNRLDDVIRVSLTSIRKERRCEKLKNGMIACLSFILFLGVGFVFCNSNRAIASKLPLIGNIFERIESESSYKGDFAQNAEELVATEGIGKLEKGEYVESDYVKTSNGITAAITGITCDETAMYISISLQNEKGFDKGLMWKKNAKNYASDIDVLAIEATGYLSFYPKQYNGGIVPYNIEGDFTDDNTFVGIMQIEMAYIKEIPNSFYYDLTISDIFGDDCFSEEIKAEGSMDDSISSPHTIHYGGKWSFHFEVQLNKNECKEIVVNDTNKDGVGIATVLKSAYGIRAKSIRPEGDDSGCWIAVICDANGDLLDTQGQIDGIYSTKGRDISKVYISVCDYSKYINELEGYYYSDDYRTKKKTRTFAQFLAENALYSTEVELEE